MNGNLEKLINDIKNIIENDRFINHKSDSGIHPIEFRNSIFEYLKKIENQIKKPEFPEYYINYFEIEIKKFYNIYSEHFSIFQEFKNIEDIKDFNKKINCIDHIFLFKKDITDSFSNLNFIYTFFDKFNFLIDNLVCVGANGSGKTSFINKLKQYTSSKITIITAQKALGIPTLSRISPPELHKIKIENSSNSDKEFKRNFNIENVFPIAFQNITTEFNELLSLSFSERMFERDKFIEKNKYSGFKDEIPVSILDECIDLWNSLITHRRLKIEGINFVVSLRDEEGKYYGPNNMSDGEKVIIYILLLILRAPDNSLIFIDEPELYLHKSIVSKLWDSIELKRPDCKFIYLTHDLDFATSRFSATKVWIKSYNYPDDWDIEKIPENTIPANLMLELIGSRRNILFCEGEHGNLDEAIYNILFSELHIIPIKGCSEVIAYTKAYNKCEGISNSAFGLIDRDYRNQQNIDALKAKRIFTLDVSEIENLFLTEEFLILLLKNPIFDAEKVNIEIIKNFIIKEFSKDMENQISSYVSLKIDFFFKERNISMGRSMDDVNTKFKSFVDEINIKDWFDERSSHLKMLLDNKNYREILKVFNNKGLVKKVGKLIGLYNMLDTSLNFLKNNEDARAALRSYFDNEMFN